MNHLENLARRLEADPFFLACPLKLHQRSAGLSDEALAASFGCPMDSLTSIRLCRAPTSEASFLDDIERIAARFSVDSGILAEAVRRGQSLYHMAAEGADSSTLLAARDSERDSAERKEDRP